jgi:hypothetical protein
MKSAILLLFLVSARSALSSPEMPSNATSLSLPPADLGSTREAYLPLPDLANVLIHSVSHFLDPQTFGRSQCLDRISSPKFIKVQKRYWQQSVHGVGILVNPDHPEIIEWMDLRLAIQKNS